MLVCHTLVPHMLSTIYHARNLTRCIFVRWLQKLVHGDQEDDKHEWNEALYAVAPHATLPSDVILTHERIEVPTVIWQSKAFWCPKHRTTRHKGQQQNHAP